MLPNYWNYKRKFGYLYLWWFKEQKVTAFFPGTWFGLGFLENRIRNFGLGSPIEKTETE
jgi:hypothetical protein